MSEILDKILQKAFVVSGNTLLNYSVLSKFMLICEQ